MITWILRKTFIVPIKPIDKKMIMLPIKVSENKTVLKYWFANFISFLWYSMDMYLEAYESSAVVTMVTYEAIVFAKATKPYSATPKFSVMNEVRKKFIR